MVTDQDRPDPLLGRLASAAYAASYAGSHLRIEDVPAYVAGYADLLLIDGMLSGYRMLDVGTGTGGFLRLARNHAMITAIDFSPSMISAARALGQELGLRDVAFAVARFEDFQDPEPFDVIRLTGTYGWYQPWAISLHAL